MPIVPISDALRGDALPDSLSGGFAHASLVNAPPIASKDSLSVMERSVIQGNLFANNGHGTDSDPEGGAIHVVAVLGKGSYVGVNLDLSAGQVRVLADGSFTFDTAGDFGYLKAGETAKVSFGYKIADEAGATAFGTATVTVTGLNDAPVLHPDYVYSNEDAVTSADLFAFNGVGVDYDPDGDPLQVVDFIGGTVNAGELAHLAGGGVVRISADGEMMFDADGDFDAMKAGELKQVTFTYNVTDGHDIRTSHVTLFVEGRNDAPVARDDAFGADVGELLAGNLFANNGYGVDYDPEGDKFILDSVDGDKSVVNTTFQLAEGGQLTVNGNGNFWFNPLNDFVHLMGGQTETISFDYGIHDAYGATASATVDIVVTGAAYTPVVAQDDALAVKEDGPMRSVDLLANDYDNPFDEPEVISVSFATSGPGTYDGPIGGLLTLDPDGRTVRFIADDDFEYLAKGARAEFAFTYEIEDKNGDRSTATVDVAVVGENDAPVAVDDQFVWSLSGGNAVMNVFNNNGFGVDYDIDVGDTLALTGIGTSSSSTPYKTIHPGAGGVIDIDRSGVIHLDPNQEDTYYNGDLEAGEQVAFYYKIEDEYGAFARAHVVIDIIA